jgi:hypothetical protein
MGKIFGLIAAFAAYMVVLGLAADLLRLFGLPIQADASFTLGTLPMLAVAGIASHGFRERKDPMQQLVMVFAFIAVWLVVSSFANPVAMIIFVGVFIAVYLKALLLSLNYYFVRRPLEQHAHKQRVLNAKLDVDATIAEATIRRERARAALEEAEQEYQAAQGHAGGKP